MAVAPPAAQHGIIPKGTGRQCADVADQAAVAAIDKPQVMNGSGPSGSLLRYWVHTTITARGKTERSTGSDSTMACGATWLPGCPPNAIGTDRPDARALPPPP